MQSGKIRNNMLDTVAILQTIRIKYKEDLKTS